MVEETGVPRIVLYNIMLNERRMKIMICMPVYKLMGAVMIVW
jgi:hypothetical protein